MLNIENDNNTRDVRRIELSPAGNGHRLSSWLVCGVGMGRQMLVG